MQIIIGAKYRFKSNAISDNASYYTSYISYYEKAFYMVAEDECNGNGQFTATFYDINDKSIKMIEGHAPKMDHVEPYISYDIKEIIKSLEKLEKKYEYR